MNHLVEKKDIYHTATPAHNFFFAIPLLSACLTIAVDPNNFWDQDIVISLGDGNTWTRDKLTVTYDQEFNLFFFQIYNDELENCENFVQFSDFCHSFTMLRGKDTEDSESNTIGELKVNYYLFIDN